MPDYFGDIYIPKDTLRLDIDKEFIDHVTQLGNKLYDFKKKSFKFLNSVKADNIILRPFHWTPIEFREYITLKSARIFQERMLGDPQISQFNAADENAAFVALRRAEIKHSPCNVLKDNKTTANSLNRTM